MPTPRKGEKKGEFISRCISYLKEKESDKYKNDKQISAVCYSMWEDSKGGSEDGR